MQHKDWGQEVWARTWLSFEPLWYLAQRGEDLDSLLPEPDSVSTPYGTHLRGGEGLDSLLPAVLMHFAWRMPPAAAASEDCCLVGAHCRCALDVCCMCGCWVPGQSVWNVCTCSNQGCSSSGCAPWGNFWNPKTLNCMWLSACTNGMVFASCCD